MTEIDKIIDGQFFVSILLLVVGAIITLVFTKLSAKTGTLRYFVTFSKVGISADDEVFGSVRLTWQGHEVRNLFLCTIQVENATTKDFENVDFKVYSGPDTILLNQRAEVADTPYIIPWDTEYQNRIHVPDGQKANQEQLNEYNHNREYCLPVFNRGQIIRFSYLCTNPNDDNEPGVYISTASKGVRLKRQQLPHLVLNPIFGVPIPAAIVRALIISVLVVIATGLWVENNWIAATICMLVGLTGQVFGAIAYRAERFLKNTVSG
jgi:hypothetical protein